ncbi:MAG: hypothetical protein JO038_00970 [Alphaproteobacteria bacterium]|nr:hypothetical protein [Alphaproteobacteria bacterium]
MPDFRSEMEQRRSPTSDRRASSEEIPSLLVGGHRNTRYNIIKLGSKYYGVHQEEGAFDIAKINARRNTKPVYIGESLEEVTRKIEAAGRP